MTHFARRWGRGKRGESKYLNWFRIVSFFTIKSVSKSDSQHRCSSKALALEKPRMDSRHQTSRSHVDVRGSFLCWKNRIVSCTRRVFSNHVLQFFDRLGRNLVNKTSRPHQNDNEYMAAERQVAMTRSRLSLPMCICWTTNIWKTKWHIAKTSMSGSS